MKQSVLAKLAFASLLSMWWCVALLAQTNVSVRTQKLTFGDHDIGTSNPQTLSATNTSDGIISLAARIVGPDPGDTPVEFSWSSNCTGSIPSKGSCDVTVFFNPTSIGKDKGDGEDRKATLTLTDGRGQPVDVRLEGRAFQNLAASPSELEFEAQVGNGRVLYAPSNSRTIQIQWLLASRSRSVAISRKTTAGV